MSNNSDASATNLFTTPPPGMENHLRALIGALESTSSSGVRYCVIKGEWMTGQRELVNAFIAEIYERRSRNEDSWNIYQYPHLSRHGWLYQLYLTLVKSGSPMPENDNFLRELAGLIDNSGAATKQVIILEDIHREHQTSLPEQLTEWFTYEQHLGNAQVLLVFVARPGTDEDHQRVDAIEQALRAAHKSYETTDLGRDITTNKELVVRIADYRCQSTELRSFVERKIESLPRGTLIWRFCLTEYIDALKKVPRLSNGSLDEQGLGSIPFADNIKMILNTKLTLLATDEQRSLVRIATLFEDGVTPGIVHEYVNIGRTGGTSALQSVDAALQAAERAGIMNHDTRGRYTFAVPQYRLMSQTTDLNAPDHWQKAALAISRQLIAVQRRSANDLVRITGKVVDSANTTNIAWSEGECAQIAKSLIDVANEGNSLTPRQIAECCETAVKLSNVPNAGSDQWPQLIDIASWLMASAYYQLGYLDKMHGVYDTLWQKANNIREKLNVLAGQTGWHDAQVHETLSTVRLRASDGTSIANVMSKYAQVIADIGQHNSTNFPEWCEVRAQLVLALYGYHYLENPRDALGPFCSNQLPRDVQASADEHPRTFMQRVSRELLDETAANNDVNRAYALIASHCAHSGISCASVEVRTNRAAQLVELVSPSGNAGQFPPAVRLAAWSRYFCTRLETGDREEADKALGEIEKFTYGSGRLELAGWLHHAWSMLLAFADGKLPVAEQHLKNVREIGRERVPVAAERMGSILAYAYAWECERLQEIGAEVSQLAAQFPQRQGFAAAALLIEAMAAGSSRDKGGVATKVLGQLTRFANGDSDGPASDPSAVVELALLCEAALALDDRKLIGKCMAQLDFFVSTHKCGWIAQPSSMVFLGSVVRLQGALAAAYYTRARTGRPRVGSPYSTEGDLMAAKQLIEAGIAANSAIGAQTYAAHGHLDMALLHAKSKNSNEARSSIKRAKEAMNDSPTVRMQRRIDDTERTYRAHGVDEPSRQDNASLGVINGMLEQGSAEGTMFMSWYHVKLWRWLFNFKCDHGTTIEFEAANQSSTMAKYRSQLHNMVKMLEIVLENSDNSSKVNTIYQILEDQRTSWSDITREEFLGTIRGLRDAGDLVVFSNEAELDIVERTLKLRANAASAQSRRRTGGDATL